MKWETADPPLPLGFLEWLIILSTCYDDVQPFLKIKRFELLDVAKLLLLFRFAVSIYKIIRIEL